MKLSTYTFEFFSLPDMFFGISFFAIYSIYQLRIESGMVNTNTMDELIYINELNVNTIYFIVQNFNIQVEGLGDSSNFTGKTIYCKCVNAGRYVAAEWALTSGY